METMEERLHNLMNLKKIKAVELAKATTITTATISRILNGTQMPKADTLYKLSQYFDVTMEFLLTGESAISQNCINAILMPDELEIIEQYRKMSALDQEDFMLIAEMKAKKAKIKKERISSLSENSNLKSETA